MPNRIIKESICDNEKLAAIKDFEFRLWVGLITQADDAGRGDARPQIIKGRVFPLRDQVTQKNISDGLDALECVGLISLYKVGGRPFYVFPGWSEHQRIRDCKPKYPAPEDADEDFCQSAAICGELPQVAASCGLNPIQSNPNPNPNPNTRDNARVRFVPPTVEEVAAYCSLRRNSVDPQRFVDYYTSNGWKVGRNAMKDWKSAVRNWEKSGEEAPKMSRAAARFAYTEQKPGAARDDSEIMRQLLKEVEG